MKTSSSIKELVSEIKSYKELDYEGWDSYGARPSDPGTRQRGIEFLKTIESVFSRLNLRMPELDVCPGVNGGVSVMYKHESKASYFWMRLEPGVTDVECTLRREQGEPPQLLTCTASAAIATLVSLVDKHAQ